MKTVIIPERVIDITGAYQSMCYSSDRDGNIIRACPQEQKANHTGYYCLAGFRPNHRQRNNECIENEVVK